MHTARSLPPGPKGRLISGNLSEFFHHRVEFLAECAEKYGDLCTFRLGPRRVHFISHPDLVEQVLVNDARYYIKHFGARMYKPVLGNGLVTSEGDFWLRQRRLSQPAFARQRLLAYAPVMVKLTEEMLSTWQEGLLIDVHRQMNHLTSAIALKTLFDLDDCPERTAYTDALREIFGLLSRRFSHLVPIPLWLPTPANRRLHHALARLRSLLDGFIQKGKARHARVPGEDLLSRLIHARDEDGTVMTDTQLRDEAMTLYLAGHETTALTLSWTWYALSRAPAVEDKLTAEWARVLGGRAPTAEDIPHLPYTDCVIKESMRLYPPVYLIGREPTEDRELGGYVMPRGTTVFMSQWVAHRDQRFFDQPLEFKPERWAEGLGERLPKYAYFPFGGGPRVCIGNTFAMMEAVLLLATVGQRYRFTLEPDPPVDFELGITMLPKAGIPALLRKR